MPRNDLKAYTSLIARIPQDLADQVKRYASEHRCTVSELIRDGLHMRLEEGSPWHVPRDSRNTDGEVVPEVLHALEALTPMLRTQFQETVRATIAEVIHEVLHEETSQHTAAREVIREVLPHGDEVVPGHTEVIPAQAIAHTTRRGMTKVIPVSAPPVQASLQGMTEVLPSQPPQTHPSHKGMTEVLPFDPVKYRLGKLCPRGHEYQGTGQSLRVNNKAGYCLACNAATNQRKRDRERQQGVRV